MPKDFLQGASLTPTFIQHFKCGELHIFHMLKNAFKKHPLQNRTNVQIKGGGGQRAFEQCSKKQHFSETMASLISLRLFFNFFFFVSADCNFFVLGALVTV